MLINRFYNINNKNKTIIKKSIIKSINNQQKKISIFRVNEMFFFTFIKINESQNLINFNFFKFVKKFKKKFKNSNFFFRVVKQKKIVVVNLK